MIKLLLARDDIDPDIKDTDDRTPLSCAVENEYEAVMKLLLTTDDISPDFKDTVFG